MKTSAHSSNICQSAADSQQEARTRAVSASNGLDADTTNLFSSLSSLPVSLSQISPAAAASSFDWDYTLRLDSRPVEDMCVGAISSTSSGVVSSSEPPDGSSDNGSFSDWGDEDDLGSITDLENLLPEEEFEESNHPPATRPQENVADASVLTTQQEMTQVLPSRAIEESLGSENKDDDDDEEDQDAEGAPRFRRYQACQWSEKFEELVAYQKAYGHCSVPHTSRDAPSLGRWVKRQRYQYKLFQEGRPESTMTPERIAALENVGFVWESHEGTWEARYNELVEFYREHGHSNVPSGYVNGKLATWVKYQRRQYKMLKNTLDQGRTLASTSKQKSSLTWDRVQKLQSLEFEWQLRRSNK
eukprot:CAMPEP_0178801178 /NCGR_PEP_ID=MMETSP0745-20121128/13215_1 /TAXON_ID=913974 /ORGANISM="Nitzschia punctata, Strain CCMP561" /LENGTH=358 /DNA_ID=CAMNT_0020460009 /DNA_START=17 /DNA_END=1094 /DNA_ORIENTATION=-